MNKYTLFFKKNVLTQLFMMISLVGFNTAFAEGNISTSQIAQVEKIAKATKTSITVMRVTTMVKVSGGNKKTNKKVVKSVMKIMKQTKGKSAWQSDIDDEKSFAKKSKSKKSELKNKKQKQTSKKIVHRTKRFPSLE